MNAPDFSLPRLHPLLKLFRAHDAPEGKPFWTLHDPISNRYYRIGWPEFECLSRFSRVKTATALKDLVERDTTLRVTVEDVGALVAFLKQKGLLAIQDQQSVFREKPSGSWLKKILHGYLFFTVPLFKPEPFLTKTLPWVRPLLSRGFLYGMMAVFAVSILMTVQRADEFFHTFTGLMSWEGILLVGAVFFVIKIVHELAHAYTAVRYGVPVPHMGVAFMVLYPILYTEVTGSWRLSSRTQRLHIGMAGVMAELCLAALALLAWNFLPYGGTGQAVAFSIVAVSLVGSLLINLNPLMRFDGYYMLSDYTGFDNLQERACAFARWRLRGILFGWRDEPPEHLAPGQRNFLTLFGFALLVYRFFLFIGIALLVYHVFFKPLGAMLMAVEILYFILLPIWGEIKVWWKRRGDIIATKRGKIVLGTLSAFIFYLFVPVTQVAMMPAVMHSAAYRSLYPPAPSYVAALMVREGQVVTQGEILIRLESPELDNEYKAARLKLQNLESLRRRGQTQTDTAAQTLTLDSDIAQLRVEIKGIEERRAELVVAAPFDGTVRDFNPLLQEGRFVKAGDLLFRLVDEADTIVTGYGGENDIAHMATGASAIFYPDGDAMTTRTLRLDALDTANSTSLRWPELASVYGGPIPAQRAEGGALVPLTTLYMARFALTADSGLPNGSVQTGRVRLELPRASTISSVFKDLLGIWRRESGLN